MNFENFVLNPSPIFIYFSYIFYAEMAKNNKYKTSTPNKNDSVGSFGNCSVSSIDTPTRNTTEKDKKHNKRTNVNKGGLGTAQANNRDKEKKITFMTFFYNRLLFNFHEL